jgi:hypothetical protein
MVWFRNTTDRQNNLTDRSLFFTASYTGPLQSYVESSFYFNKQVVNGTPYTMNLWEFYATAKPAGGIDAFFYTTIGDSIDYANSREAKSLLFNSGIEFGCGRHLNVNITHTFQRLSFKTDKIFSANLLQSRFIYNLNVRTFVRAIIQYYNIHQNPGLYVDPVNPKTQTLFTQFLFSSKLNPQTVLFLGYSDNHLGLQSIDLTRRNRTFFLKIGNALVM